jgi:hypothetical protein
MSGEASQQRRVLETALAYLKAMQSAGTPPLAGFTPDQTGAISPLPPNSSALEAEIQSQRVLQTVLEEVQYLRSQMLGPLTQEIIALQQQRETLHNEVRQLELERLNQTRSATSSQFSPAGSAEMADQIRRAVVEQLAPYFRSLQAQINSVPTLSEGLLDPQELAAQLPQLTPQERLAQLMQIQAQTDDRLLRLDGHLRSLFESLEQNIQSYCDALTQGLDAMHGLGQQGEVIFCAFVNHLAQQLAQESEYFLSGDEPSGQLQSGHRRYPMPPSDTDPSASRDQAASMDLEEVNLSDVDWDVELEENEEVTLFQVDGDLDALDGDEEAGDEPVVVQAASDLLALDDLPDLEDIANDDLEEEFSEEDMTIFQTEPIPWSGLINQPPASTVEATRDRGYEEEIDALEEVLFGDGTASSANAEAPSAPGAIAAASADFFAQPSLEEALDATLLNLNSSPTPDEEASDPSKQATTEVISTTEYPLATVPEEAPAVSFDELFIANVTEAIEPEVSSPVEPESPLVSLLGTEGAQEIAAPEARSLDDDTITSLADLLPDTSSSHAHTDIFGLVEESEDAFIPAPKDEDLLTPEGEGMGSRIDFSLDESIYGQLNDDLSHLEGLPPDMFSSERSYNLGDISTSEPDDLDAIAPPPVEDMTAPAAVDWAAVSENLATPDDEDTLTDPVVAENMLEIAPETPEAIEPFDFPSVPLNPLSEESQAVSSAEAMLSAIAADEADENEVEAVETEDISPDLTWEMVPAVSGLSEDSDLGVESSPATDDEAPAAVNLDLGDPLYMGELGMDLEAAALAAIVDDLATPEIDLGMDFQAALTDAVAPTTEIDDSDAFGGMFESEDMENPAVSLLSADNLNPEIESADNLNEELPVTTIQDTVQDTGEVSFDPLALVEPEPAPAVTIELPLEILPELDLVISTEEIPLTMESAEPDDIDTAERMGGEHTISPLDEPLTLESGFFLEDSPTPTVEPVEAFPSLEDLEARPLPSELLFSEESSLSQPTTLPGEDSDEIVSASSLLEDFSLTVPDTPPDAPSEAFPSLSEEFFSLEALNAALEEPAPATFSPDVVTVENWADTFGAAMPADASTTLPLGEIDLNLSLDLQVSDASLVESIRDRSANPTESPPPLRPVPGAIIHPEDFAPATEAATLDVLFGDISLESPVSLSDLGEDLLGDSSSRPETPRLSRGEIALPEDFAPGAEAAEQLPFDIGRSTVSPPALPTAEDLFRDIDETPPPPPRIHSGIALPEDFAPGAETAKRLALGLIGDHDKGFAIADAPLPVGFEQVLAAIPDNDEMDLRATEIEAEPPIEPGFHPPSVDTFGVTLTEFLETSWGEEFALSGDYEEGFQFASEEAEDTLEQLFADIPEADDPLEAGGTAATAPAQDLMAQDFMPSDEPSLPISNPDPLTDGTADNLTSLADLGFAKPTQPLEIEPYNPVQMEADFSAIAAELSDVSDRQSPLEPDEGIEMIGTPETGYLAVADTMVAETLEAVLQDIPDAPETHEVAQEEIAPEAIGSSDQPAITPPTLDLMGSYETGFQLAEPDLSTTMTLDNAFAALEEEPEEPSMDPALDSVLSLDDLFAHDFPATSIEEVAVQVSLPASPAESTDALLSSDSVPVTAAEAITENILEALETPPDPTLQATPPTADPQILHAEDFLTDAIAADDSLATPMTWSETSETLSAQEFADLFPPTPEPPATPLEVADALAIVEESGSTLEPSPLSDPLAEDFQVDPQHRAPELGGGIDLVEDGMPDPLTASETTAISGDWEMEDLSPSDLSPSDLAMDEAFQAAFSEDFADPEPITDLDPDTLQYDLDKLTELAHALQAEAAETIPAPKFFSTSPPTEAPAVPLADETGTAPLAGELVITPSTQEPDDELPFGSRSVPPEEEWFLGIDIGSTGLSAVLMNPTSGAAHPLYWSRATSPNHPEQATFRLPLAIAFQATGSATAPTWEAAAIAFAALEKPPENPSLQVLTGLKPYLKVGIPHQTEAGVESPQIQWTGQHTLSLRQVLDSLQALVTWLQSPSDATFTLEAVGLETATLHDCLDNLHGVVVGHPSNWSDTYRFNMRELILGAGLVETASQVFFLEEAIAAVLSGLPDPNTPPITPSRQTQTLYQCNWQGGTVVISGGASCTEIGLVNLPQPLDTLTREDFSLRNFAYGGDALELDIICQLLVPAERRQPLTPGDRRSAKATGWSWQAVLPEVLNARWDDLALHGIDLPQLAEPDLANRLYLRQHLSASRLGLSLLEAARYLKLILQHQNQFSLELADQTWRVLRRDLEARVLVPFMQRLNQHLNALLSQTGIAAQAVNQVICTGGNVSFAAIAKWLREKFPNATIIQDTYPTNRPLSCSRVAYGLVNLSRYPQVLDVSRHQYSDYFLLYEMTHTLPENPLPLQGILHLLEEQGINTDVCRSRIEAILEGHLPPGLVPDLNTRPYLSRSTRAETTYQALTHDRLFSKPARQIYLLDGAQRDRLRTHLDHLLSGKHQSLAEPLMTQLVTPWF